MTRDIHRRAGSTRLSDSPTYGSWVAMKGRVFNPNNPAYASYGGRGIRCCKGWLGFQGFFADMGERPDGRTLDRVNNDGHYSCGHCEECMANAWPANCRWATPMEQAHNKRPAPKRGGRPQEEQWHVPCACGGRMSRMSTRCQACRVAGARERDTVILQLRSQGWKNVEIACELGMTRGAVGGAIGRLRRAGIEIPPSPYRARREMVA